MKTGLKVQLQILEHIQTRNKYVEESNMLLKKKKIYQHTVITSDCVLIHDTLDLMLFASISISSLSRDDSMKYVALYSS